jgi:hypothetical protein
VEPQSIEERVLRLEERQTRLADDIHSLRGSLTSIEEKVGKFNDKLAARPSWAVSTVITILFGGCTTLAALLAAAVG